MTLWMRFYKHLWQAPGQEHLWTVLFVCCCLIVHSVCGLCVGGGWDTIMEGFKAHRGKISIYLRGSWEPLQDPEEGGAYDLRREALLCVALSHPPPQLPCKCGLKATTEREG